jgi:hypothetical protein
VELEAGRGSSDTGKVELVRLKRGEVAAGVVEADSQWLTVTAASYGYQRRWMAAATTWWGRSTTGLVVGAWRRRDEGGQRLGHREVDTDGRCGEIEIDKGQWDLDRRRIRTPPDWWRGPADLGGSGNSGGGATAGGGDRRQPPDGTRGGSWWGLGPAGGGCSGIWRRVWQCRASGDGDRKYGPLDVDKVEIWIEMKEKEIKRENEK